MSGFEMYRAHRGRAHLMGSREPRASLTNRGYLSLNPAALELVPHEHTQGLVLLFDRGTGQIGIRPRAADEPLSARLMVKRKRDSQAGILSARSALVFFGVDLARAAGVYPVGWDERTRLAIIQLPPGTWQRPPVDATAVRERLRAARKGAA